jgi:3-methyladenine DNA glycosylase AlkD
MDKETLMLRLKKMGNPSAVPHMARYGINSEYALGIRIPLLRKLAKEIGENHDLAIAVWETKIHEGRILASMIASPKHTTQDLMEDWVGEFNSWDLCDQVCMNLFEKTVYAWSKVPEWCRRENEFEKRAGFVLIARLAVSDKTSPDFMFENLIPWLETGSEDHRNFVKKAVNWAIRQTGKRNLSLNTKMTCLCEVLLKKDSSPARWIASDALRELRNEKVLNRLTRRMKR